MISLFCQQPRVFDHRDCQYYHSRSERLLSALKAGLSDRSDIICRMFVISDHVNWETRKLCQEEPDGHLLTMAETDEEIKAGLDVCRRCPSLGECELWGWERRGHIVGVVGGVHYSERTTSTRGGERGRWILSGVGKDLYWLEDDGKRAYGSYAKAREVPICQFCNMRCSGKCERLNSRYVEADIEPLERHPHYKKDAKVTRNDVPEPGKDFCNKCGQLLPIEKLAVSRTAPKGYLNYCRKCRAAKRLAHQRARGVKPRKNNHRELPDGTRQVLCRDCKKWLPPDVMSKNKQKRWGVNSQCRACHAAWHKDYYRKTKHRLKKEKSALSENVGQEGMPGGDDTSR